MCQGEKKGKRGRKRGRKINKKRAMCTNYHNCSRAGRARYREEMLIK
jgi:hypothetical protein